MDLKKSKITLVKYNSVENLYHFLSRLSYIEIDNVNDNFTLSELRRESKLNILIEDSEKEKWIFVNVESVNMMIENKPGQRGSHKVDIIKRFISKLNLDFKLIFGYQNDLLYHDLLSHINLSLDIGENGEVSENYSNFKN